MLGVSRVLQCCGWTSIPSCSRKDLEPGDSLFKVTLDISGCCCSVLLWPICTPVVPSCWFVGKKLGCCCLLYIVFWILLQRGVWTLRGKLLWFGSHPEHIFADPMACELLLFNHKWNKAQKLRCDVELKHPASLDVRLSQLGPVSAEHKGLVILAVAWLGAMNTNDPKSSLLAYVRIISNVFMPVNFADSRFPRGARDPGNYVKSYCKCT